MGQVRSATRLWSRLNAVEQAGAFDTSKAIDYLKDIVGERIKKDDIELSRGREDAERREYRDGVQACDK